MAPRLAQKKRTRSALLAAARDVIARGEEVTVSRVADEAGISRATAYRHFPEPGLITSEVTLDLDLMDTADLLEGITDVRMRVHKIARYYLEFIREHEGAFRLFLAQTMHHWSRDKAAELRGARRVDAFLAALAPIRGRMAPEDMKDLAYRLSMLTGVEQHIALDDVLGVDVETGYRLQKGIVDAVLEAYLPHD